MQKLVRCFLGADMRCQHDGLAKIAKKEKVNVYKLPKGSHVVFINTKLDRIKMFSPGGVLSYLRLPRGQKFELETLRQIPDAFANGDLEVAYSKALKSVVTKRLEELRGIAEESE